MPENHNIYPEVSALKGKAEKLMIFLHGVGSDGNDLISLAPFIQKPLPEYHFIAPNGIEAFDMAPYGYQWFSLQNRSDETLGNLLSKNAPIVQDIIKQKQDELGLTNADTVIFGFSQGTMLGIYLTLIQKEAFHATIGFSGRLIKPLEISNFKTPICIIHGENDEIVPASASEEIADYLQNAKINHKTLIVPGLTHSIDAKGMEFAINFLNKYNNR